VVLMGQSRVREITDFLRGEGCAFDLPAAAVAHATAADARLVISNLNELTADAADLPSPAILVIGRVVDHRQAMHCASLMFSESV